MQEAFTDTSKTGAVANSVRGVIGAAIGGVAGYVVFGWILRQGFYVGILPGAMVGLGCGQFIRRRSVPLAVVCGLAALALGIFTEWKHLPFRLDGSFEYFIGHLFDLQPIKLLMLAGGGFCGYWFALGGATKAAPGFTV